MKRRPIVINQSSLKDYMNCRRLWAWRRHQNLDVPGKRAVLEIGTATHKGLAVFDAGGVGSELARLRAMPEKTQEDFSQMKFLESISKWPAKEQCVAVARRYLEQSAGPAVSFADKSLDEAVEVIDRILPAYIDYWGDQGELWKPLNQEIEFLVEVGEGTDNYLRGKADNLSTYKSALYLVDKKTAGRNDPRDLLKYELDIQLTGYVYGLTKHLSQEAIAQGRPPVFIRGAIIDVLVKTKVPQFIRELYTRTVDELEDFEVEFNEYADEIRRNEDRVSDGTPWKTAFPKNTEHCFRYGVCAFRDLCLKDNQVRRQMYVRRKADYVDDAKKQLEIAWAAGTGA